MCVARIRIYPPHRKGLVGLKAQTKNAHSLDKVRQIRHHRDRHRKPCNKPCPLPIQANPRIHPNKLDKANHLNKLRPPGKCNPRSCDELLVVPPFRFPFSWLDTNVPLKVQTYLLAIPRQQASQRRPAPAVGGAPHQSHEPTGLQPQGNPGNG